jgi:hypothetical protein
MINKLCMPALIYLIFSFTHVVIDTYKGLYNTAMIEIWIGIVFTILLNLLCSSGLGIVSWLIISIPFVLMTVIASIILFAFKLNPATGTAITQPTQSTQQPTQSTNQQSQQQQPQQQQQPTQSTTQPIQPSGYAYPLSVAYQF